MTWQALIDKASGDLVSVGTVLAADAAERFDVLDLGDERPDGEAAIWDRDSRSFVARPAPVLLDRLDDVEARLQSDPDFRAVWDNLSAARRTQVRAGIRAVLAVLLGARRFRREGERVEVD